jgi:hypothetical protein
MDAALDVARLQTETALAVAYKQVIATMRQKWIDNLRERISEFVSIVVSFHRVRMVTALAAERSKSEEHAETLRMVLLLTQVELMLNPIEPDHIELFDKLKKIKRAAWNEGPNSGVEDAVTHMSECCKKVVSDKVSLICTDEHKGYLGLRPNYPHKIIRHTTGSYVHGNIHTNTVEGFWSIFKRGIVGTFHKVSKRYLPLYVAKFEFRYNNRKNADIFGSAVRAC